MVIRMDHEMQLLRKQDSYIFFFQMEPEGVIHALLKAGTQWHHQQQNQGSMQTEEYKPLRVALIQTLTSHLSQRLTRLSQCNQTDSLYQTAVKTETSTATGDFRFHRWNMDQKKLLTTAQEPISMARMLKYVQQMEDIFKDHETTMKFRSLRAHPGQVVTPWQLQLALRSDEAHAMMRALCGCKVWTLIGASLKQHSLLQSHQGQQLRAHQPKGRGKGKGKLKTK